MLSVVIPAYQAEAHLSRLLESLDSAPDWEPIIVDDGSSDATARIAREWLDERRCGQLIHLNHGSPGHARQVGLEAATGDFVTYADADDRVIVSVLDQAPSFLDQFSADVFIAGYEAVSDDKSSNTLATECVEVRAAPSRRALTSRAAVWGKVYRRSFLREQKIAFPALRIADDVIFSWRLAAARPRVIETSDVGYSYWIAPHGQLTGDPKYFIEGLESLALLRMQAVDSDRHGRTLGDYAYWKGALHIMRRSHPRQRPRVGRIAVSNYVSARGGMWR